MSTQTQLGPVYKRRRVCVSRTKSTADRLCTPTLLAPCATPDARSTSPPFFPCLDPSNDKQTVVLDYGGL
ncbi:hypothetical protein [Pandoravirus japonicus]|uniref:Uncharacterized protein n=1 Tax=Pandoravirus japonicus TaxID=2823154 RepID=A0A811BRY7_9VIRU|nr:hypothetical protein [Pandoravirus japonicus]